MAACLSIVLCNRCSLCAALPVKHADFSVKLCWKRQRNKQDGGFVWQKLFFIIYIQTFNAKYKFERLPD